MLHAIPILTDNYCWLFQDNDNAIVVDPGDAEPIQLFLSQHQLNLAAILLTHEHADHIQGAQPLAAHKQAPIYGSPIIAPQIPSLIALDPGMELQLLNQTIRVMDLSGHSHGHLGYYFQEAKLAMVGDALFSIGCGRVFTGDYAAMWNSLQRIMALPPDTLLCCGHEYTNGNLRFAQQLEPDNQALHAYATKIAQQRQANQPSLPTQLATEIALNPFLRCAAPAFRQQLGLPNDALSAFTQLRQQKDMF